MSRNDFQPTRPVPLNGASFYFHQGSFGYSPIGAYSMPIQHNAYSPLMVTPMDTPMVEDVSDEMGKDDLNNVDQEMFEFDEQMERQNQQQSMYSMNQFSHNYQQQFAQNQHCQNGYFNQNTQNCQNPQNNQNVFMQGYHQHQHSQQCYPMGNGRYAQHQNGMNQCGGSQRISTRHINQQQSMFQNNQQNQMTQPNYNEMNIIQKSALSDVGRHPTPNFQYFGGANFNGSFANTNDIPFHYLHNAQRQQMDIQHSSMPQNEIETIRETPISVRDFGLHDVDDEYSDEDFDDFENEGFSDESDEDINEADEVFQEVMETMEELKRIGDQNNRLLHNMIESQK